LNRRKTGRREERSKRRGCGGEEGTYLLHVFVEEVKDVVFLSFLPVTFDMVVPGPPRHWGVDREHIQRLLRSR
jgi:hypothetical protein